jgi:hypothetical protein
MQARKGKSVRLPSSRDTGKLEGGRVVKKRAVEAASAESTDHEILKEEGQRADISIR